MLRITSTQRITCLQVTTIHTPTIYSLLLSASCSHLSPTAINPILSLTMTSISLPFLMFRGQTRQTQRQQQRCSHYRTWSPHRTTQPQHQQRTRQKTLRSCGTTGFSFVHDLFSTCLGPRTNGGFGEGIERLLDSVGDFPR